MTAKYSVHSFQINIGVGDGAIHLLCTRDTDDGIKTVQRAIMVDGGEQEQVMTPVPVPGKPNMMKMKNVTTFHPNIDGTIKYIEDNFTCQGPEKDGGVAGDKLRLRFHAFVVTHWDTDHSNGVMHFLKKDVQDQYDARNNGPNPVQPGDIRLKRATYLQNVPTSFFYAPSWKTFQERNVTGGTMFPTNAWDRIFRTDSDNGKGAELASTAQLSVCFAPDSDPPPWSAHLLRVHASTTTLLGRNLFRLDLYQAPQKGQPVLKDSASVEALMDASSSVLANYPAPSDDSQVPGLYCVAVNGRVIRSSAKVRSITPKNRSSISLLVIWSRANKDQPHRISHYLAGDAHKQLESAICDWIGFTKADYNHLTVVKLSHHGAWPTSSPIDLFKRLKPQTIIVSAHDDKGYGHPRWEILQYLYGWITYNTDTGLVDDTRLFLTNYPYYIWDRQGPLDPKHMPKTSMAVSKAKVIFTYIKIARDLLDQARNAVAPKPQLSLPNAQFALDVLTNLKGWDKETKLAKIFQDVRDTVLRNICPNNNRLVLATTEVESVCFEVLGFVSAREKVRVKYVGQAQADDALILPQRYVKQDSHNESYRGATAHRRTKTASSIESWAMVSGPDSDCCSETQTDDDDGADSDADIVSQKWSLVRPAAIHHPFVSRSPTAYDEDSYMRLIPEGSSLPSQPKDILVPKNNPLHPFISALATEQLCLQRNPAPGAGVRIPFADNDEWLSWMREALLSDKAQMEFVPASWPLSGDKTATAVADFTCRAPIGGGRVLILDTKEAPTVLGVSQAAVNNMYSQSRIMSFGARIGRAEEDEPPRMLRGKGSHAGVVANAPANQTWTLTELAKFVELGDNVIVTALGPLELVPATSVPSAGNPTKMVPCRNALWFEAGAPHFTDLRLEFTLSGDSPLDAFRKWLGSADGLHGFSVEHVSVVARKTWRMRYGPNSDTVTAEGEIAFALTVKLAGVTFSAHLSIASGARFFTIRLRHDEPDENLLVALFDWIAKALNLGSTDDFEGKKWIDLAEERKFLGAIRPRLFEITIACNDRGVPTGVDGVRLELQIEVAVGKAPPGQEKADRPLVFLVALGWARQMRAFLRGRLWCPPPEPKDSFLAALPTYRAETDLRPILDAGRSPLEALDLQALVGLPGALPRGIPTIVSQAELELTADGMSFAGALACGDDTEPRSPNSVPSIKIDSLKVKVGCAWTTSPVQWVFGFDICIYLYPGGAPPSLENEEIDDNDDEKDDDDSEDELDPASLRGTIDYIAGRWELCASVSNLTVAHLANFFDDDSRTGAMALLKHLGIDYLSLKYTYDSGDKAGGKEFEFIGVLLLGPLRMRLSFYHREGKWGFEATLEVGDDDLGPQGSITLGDLLQGLMNGTIGELPEAVRDIPVAKPGNSSELLRFSCSKTAGPADAKGEPTEIIILVASVHISSVSLTFTQWRGTRWPSTCPSKRVVKVAVSDIGPLEAPLVGRIENLPLQEVSYVWVSDEATANLPQVPSTAGESQEKAGITKAEFRLLSEMVGNKQDRLFFKPEKADVDKILETDVVLLAASHLMVIAKDAKGQETAVLDYIFARPKAKSPNPPGPKPPAIYSTEDSDTYYNGDPTTVVGPPGDAQTSAEKDVSKAPFKAAIGPLSIENIGLRFDLKTQRLGIVLDATFLMGPIGLALLGFGLSARLGAQSTDKPSPPGDPKQGGGGGGGLALSELAVSLEGMIVSFDRPPVTVAGGFMHSNIDGTDCYAGGLVIGFKLYTIEAVGVYAKVSKNPPKKQLTLQRVYDLESAEDEMLREQELWALDDKGDETFTMFFVMFRIEGPLFSVGFADIAGLTGGVGINTEMRLPTAETVLSFPFVRPTSSGMPGPESSPIQSLMSLLQPPKAGKDSAAPWFTAKDGSFWFAAGFKATAFQMLSVDALVVVQLNPEIQLGIYGVAVCDVPSLASPVKFAHAELGIACTLDVGAGTFKLEAQLSPRSFILDSSCHLTGGMALYAWFAPRVPSADPETRGMQGDWVLTIGGYHQAFNRPRPYPNPPRLGINWSLSNALRISGEAYFAITPRVCMAGGKLNASLTLGALSAWFDAFLDMLLNFEPFYFRAVGGVSVGVRFSMDLWLVTIRISVEIGATLTVAGPPIAGMVHVDFWVFGFDIQFGGEMAPRPDKRGLRQFKELVFKAKPSASGVLPGNIFDMSRSGGQVAREFDDDEDSGEWFALGSSIEDASVGRRIAESEQTTKPFLFNCDSGLVAPTKIDGQKKPLSPTGEETSESQAFPPSSLLGEGEQQKKKMWVVQPGPFSFSITFAFATSKGTLEDKRKGAPMPTQPMRKFTAEHDRIFALPMHLTKKMTVGVKVRITQQEEDAVQLRRMKPGSNEFQVASEDWKDGEWKVMPVVKAVPYSLWGKYDENNDPAVRGNNVSALLGGKAASNNGDDSATVPLVMGLTIAPPAPRLSSDQIPKFNLVRDTKETVQKAAFPYPHKTTNKAWAPREADRKGSHTPRGGLDRPGRGLGPSDDNRNDGEEEKKRREKERWDKFKKAWQNEQNKPEEVVSRWAKRLAFADAALSGKRPDKLLARFEQMVPALPMTAVGFD